MNPELITLAIQETPAIIARIKELFAKNNPDAPALTDEDVIFAYNQAFESSLAKDEQWLQQHPKEN